MAFHRSVWVTVLLSSCLQMIVSGMLGFIFLTSVTSRAQPKAQNILVLLTIGLTLLFLFGLIQAIASISLLKKEETFKKGCMIVFCFSLLSLNAISLLAVVLGLFIPSRKQI